MTRQEKIQALQNVKSSYEEIQSAMQIDLATTRQSVVDQITEQTNRNLSVLDAGIKKIYDHYEAELSTAAARIELLEQQITATEDFPKPE